MIRTQKEVRTVAVNLVNSLVADMIGDDFFRHPSTAKRQNEWDALLSEMHEKAHSILLDHVSVSD